MISLDQLLLQFRFRYPTNPQTPRIRCRTSLGIHRRIRLSKPGQTSQMSQRKRLVTILSLWLQGETILESRVSTSVNDHNFLSFWSRNAFLIIYLGHVLFVISSVLAKPFVQNKNNNDWGDRTTEANWNFATNVILSFSSVFIKSGLVKDRNAYLQIPGKKSPN